MPGKATQIDITRRTFVKLGCALLPGTMISLPAPAQTAPHARLIVIIDDIPDDIGASQFEHLFFKFLRVGIPVSCVIGTKQLRPRATSQRTRNQAGAMIRALSTRATGQMEIVLHMADDADSNRYFQMRSAEKLRSAAVSFLNAEGTAPVRTPIISTMERREERQVDISAQRSAGFRVLIRPGVDEPLTTEFAGRGQMQLTGGARLRLTDPQQAIHAQLDAALDGGRDAMLVVSLAGITAGNALQLRDTMGGIARAIETAIVSGRVIAMRPMDLFYSSAPYLSADRAIILPIGDTIPEKTAVQTFAGDLRSAGLPFSVEARVAPHWLANADDLCPVWPDSQDRAAQAAPGAPHCLLLPHPPLASLADGVPGLLVVPGQGRAWNGVRADGRMHLTCRDWAQTGTAADMPFDDLVIKIRPADVMSPHQRWALVFELKEAVLGGQVRLHAVAQLAALLVAPEPVLTRFWSTRQRMASDPPRAKALGHTAHAMFLDDARLAWTFIERFTDQVTGLCAGTVSGAPGGRVNLEASLWDLASQVQGIIAASTMDILPQDEARDRIVAMLGNLPSINLFGLNLPPAMFRTDSTAQVAVRGFDICDTGRFLIALRSAVKSGLITQAEAIAARGQWDLAALVEDGHIFNILDGRRVDVTASHCTPYMSRAFDALGLPLRSPYSSLGPSSGADDHMRLLYSAAYIGAMGTEPLLLEAVEQGASPEVAFLSAVLFDAQLSWYETTGQIKSVSESPLNIAPWFIYQGLRVDRLGQEAWTLQSPSRSRRFQTPEFRESAEVVSAKSAYLWAAVHPHRYSDMLVDLMRDKGRIDNLGFSVGLFTSTLEPMENYSDLNTNGIILSAIGSMHNRQHPDQG